MVTPRDGVWGTCLNVVKRNVDFAQFSRDGRFFCSSWSSRDNRVSGVSISDATTGNPLRTVRRECEVKSADIHPNNRLVVSLLEDGTVEEWDWTSEMRSGSMYAWAEEESEDGNEWSSGGQVVYNEDGSRIVCHRQNRKGLVKKSSRTFFNHQEFPGIFY